MKLPNLSPDSYWANLFFPALVGYIVMPQAAVNGRPTLGSVERLDTSVLDTLIAPDACLEVIADKNMWAEGPLWVKEEKDPTHGFLLWSDVKKNRIYRWEEGAGLFTIGKSIYLQDSGCRVNASRCQSLIEPGSNGLTLEPETGLVVMCEHGERRVARLERNGSFTPLATHYQGKRLNSPNDLVFGPGGDLYFTDPPYGLNGKEEDPLRELTLSAVYRVPSASLAAQRTDSPMGSPDVELVHGDLKRPNGLAFSPDFSKLYVADSDADDPHWLVLTMDAVTGLATEHSVFASAKPFQAGRDGSTRIGNPDGLKVDEKGNLFATGPGGVLILSPEAKLLGTILTGKKTANVAFSEDGIGSGNGGCSFLYVCADDVVGRIPLLTKAAPAPPLTREKAGGRNMRGGSEANVCVGPDGDGNSC
jgi:gluconolactonase